MELLLDPLGEALPPHLRDVPRARPESQAIQSVNDFLIGIQFLFKGIGPLAARGATIATSLTAVKNARFISLVPPWSGI